MANSDLVFWILLHLCVTSVFALMITESRSFKTEAESALKVQTGL